MRAICLKLVIVFVFSFNYSNVKAQSTPEPKGSFRADIMLPLTTGNYTFKRFTDGLGDVSIAYQHNLFKGLYLGGGFHYTYVHIDPFAIQSDIKGGLHYPGVYLKLGFEKFISEKFAIDFGVKGGYSMLFSVNDTCKATLGKPFITHMPFIQTQLQFTLMASEKDGFSISIAYSHFFDNFRPEYVCFDNFSGYKNSDSAGVTQMFSLGFSYVHYFNWK